MANQMKKPKYGIGSGNDLQGVAIVEISEDDMQFAKRLGELMDGIGDNFPADLKELLSAALTDPNHSNEFRLIHYLAIRCFIADFENQDFSKMIAAHQ